MWSKRRVCVGEQGWRDGEVEKETEVFGCVCVCLCVCVCVCMERHGVGLCECECVLERLGFVCVYVSRDWGVWGFRDRCLCVCVCVGMGSLWRKTSVFLCLYMSTQGCECGIRERECV